MYTKTKTIVAMVLAVTLVLSAVMPALAHSSSQYGVIEKLSGDTENRYFGSNAIGWIIDEKSHTNGKTLKYKYASAVPQSVKTKFESAVDMWNNSSPATVEMSEDSAGSGTIMMDDDLDSSVAATYLMICDPDTGHQISWMILINSDSVNGNASTLTSKKLSREIGHVIGMKTVTGTNNTNKIMYSGSLTATAPADIEAKGARLILGRHYSHTWEYQYSGNGKHYRRCSYCHGKKYLSTESCTYNSSGVCTKCGSLQGSGTEGVTLPEVTGMSLWEEQRRAFRFLIV